MHDRVKECDTIVQRLNSSMQKHWPELHIEQYGSMATQLCLPHSDLDLVVVGFGSGSVATKATSATKQRKKPTRKFSIAALVQQLRKLRWIQSITSIESARVPVVKMMATLPSSKASKTDKSKKGGSGETKRRSRTFVVDITFDPSKAKTVAKGRLLKQPVPCRSPQKSTGMYTPSSEKVCFFDCKMTPCPHLDTTHTGLAASGLLKHYIQLLPPLKILSLVLKQFLYERSLGDTYTGGLSSYCLVLMVVSFLLNRDAEKVTLKATQHVRPLLPFLSYQTGQKQQSTPRVATRQQFMLPASHQQQQQQQRTTHVAELKQANSPGSPVEEEPPYGGEDLGALLMQFLDFYRQFDFRTMGILPKPQGPGQSCFYRLASLSPTLVMADPFNPANNIGKAMFAMWNIQQAFGSAFDQLTYTAGGANTAFNGTLLGSILHGGEQPKK
jgi:DNA polymerase sigma